MIRIRKSADRGHASHGWLDSFHTFSFAEYFDPRHMGFRSLRVINEDTVAPGRGFGSHSHRDMEIVSYVLSGALTHKDSMGHEERLGPNESQHMSAGTGIVHSEYNASLKEPVHFLQIWIEPAERGVIPAYSQFSVTPESRKDVLKLLAGPQGGDGAAQINQDARLYVSELSPRAELDYTLSRGRAAWLHVINGGVTINGVALATGDAAAIEDETRVSIEGAADRTSELLLFDLA